MTEAFDIADYWRERGAGYLESVEIKPTDHANCPDIPAGVDHAHFSDIDCTEIEYTLRPVDSKT